MNEWTIEPLSPAVQGSTANAALGLAGNEPQRQDCVIPGRPKLA